MAWARISDDFHDHSKVAELTVDLEGLASLGLWTLALSWVRADRRRAGIVPTGIAMRFSAGHGKQLASRLVQASLWDEIPGGWRFHDFEDIYTPEDLAQKRAEAGRMGGRRSGQVRRERASGSKNEATSKQSASENEAKSPEASHARAGATTHYPDASYEASPPLSPPEGDGGEPPKKPRQRGWRIENDDFKVTDEMVAWARKEVPGVDGRRETEKFLDHWRSASGATASKRDWVAAWRNWMRKAAERLPSNVVALRRDQPAPNGYRPPTTDARVAQALALGDLFPDDDPQEIR